MLQQNQQEAERNAYVSTPPAPQTTTPEPTEVPLELMNTMRVLLHSKDKSVRVDAMNKLVQRGTQGMEILFKIIEEDKVIRDKRRQTGLIIYFSIVGTIVVFSIILKTHTLINMIGSFTAILTVGAAATVAQKQSALALSQIEDKRAVPYLLEALDYHDKEVSMSAEKALVKLLPKMLFEDAYTLHFTKDHRKALHKLLKAKNTEVVLAALKALEQVGDETAIEPVGDLMNRANTAPDVKVAAQQCISYLKVNGERHRDAQSLLRASSAVDIPNADLLRPAHSDNTTPSEELLRPVTSDQDSTKP